MIYKQDILEKAVEVAKEAARGGNTTYPSVIIQDAYNKILEIAQANGSVAD